MKTITLDGVIAEARAWEVERAKLWDAEGSPVLPHPDDWHGSDDWAAGIVHKLLEWAAIADGAADE